MPTKSLNAILTSMLKSHRQTERKLAAYLISEPSRAAVMTAEQLAEAAGVSTASVSRMIRASGLLCYAQLRSELAAEEDPALPDCSLPASDAAAAMTNVCGLVKSSIESCRGMMTAELLDKCADLLSCGSEIYIIGSGTSSVTAQYAYIKLFRLGLTCSVSSDGIIMKMKSSLMKRGSVLIAVSSSGRTKIIVESAELAAKSGAKVVVLTDYRTSPLAKTADILLSTTNRQSPAASDAELPLIQGQLTIIDMLYSLLSTRLGNDAFEFTRDIVLGDKQIL